MSFSGNCGCSDNAQYTGGTAISKANTANSSLDGTGGISVLSGATNGTLIKSVIIKATQAVTTGMIRFFIQNTLSVNSL